MEYIGCQVGSRYKNTVHLLSALVERSGRQNEKDFQILSLLHKKVCDTRGSIVKNE